MKAEWDVGDHLKSPGNLSTLAFSVHGTGSLQLGSSSEICEANFSSQYQVGLGGQPATLQLGPGHFPLPQHGFCHWLVMLESAESKETCGWFVAGLEQ